MSGRGPFYIATKKFGPLAGESWAQYIKWSGLTQLRELVSLDGMICTTVLPEIKNDYWPFIVNENYMLYYFTDPEYLLTQIQNVPKKNLLCVFLDPAEQPITPAGPVQFSWRGYDLIEVNGDISALCNCGGFPKAFSNSELNEVGLLSDLGRAREVQARLREFYPKEHHSHANCDVWAIFQADGI
jgi:hypothetical protein